MPTRRRGLTLRVTDFGPIKRADLRIRPFTVLIGGNNTGKSYSVLLVRAFSRVLSSDQSLEAIFDKFWRSQRDHKYRRSVLVKRALKAIQSPAYVRTLERLFRNELIATFGVGSLETLVRSGKESALVELTNEMASFKVRITRETLHLSFQPVVPKLEKLVHRELRDFKGPIRSTNVATIVWRTTSRLLEGELHFLAASRAGIAQSYRVMTASLIKRIPYMPFGYRVPALSSPTAEFISDAILSENVSNILADVPAADQFNRIISRWERGVLKGQVNLKKKRKEEIPEIVFRFKELELPLSQSSSSVGELAPLIVFLKYHLLRKGQVLVIEEPEAHLHPANIVEMARLLGQIRNAGLDLLVTTHSDYLLSSLNSLIKQFAVEGRVEKVRGRFTDSIDPKLVAAYEFVGKHGGTVARPLTISREGIPIDEFNRIVSELQERHAALSK